MNEGKIPAGFEPKTILNMRRVLYQCASSSSLTWRLIISSEAMTEAARVGVEAEAEELEGKFGS